MDEHLLWIISRPDFSAHNLFSACDPAGRHQPTISEQDSADAEYFADEGAEMIEERFLAGSQQYEHSLSVKPTLGHAMEEATDLMTYLIKLRDDMQKARADLELAAEMLAGRSLPSGCMSYHEHKNWDAKTQMAETLVHRALNVLTHGNVEGVDYNQD